MKPLDFIAMIYLAVCITICIVGFTISMGYLITGVINYFTGY